jgi:ATP-binding cassette, subfamily C (CFTR/MRP), member 1
MNTSSYMPLSDLKCLASDSKFGPAVAHECRSFDFTLYFEQIFLSLAPSLFLILLSPIRVATVFRRDIKTLSTPFHASKLVRSHISISKGLAKTDIPRLWL